MFRYTFVLLCAVLVLSNVALIHGRKFGGGGGRRPGGGSHSYPSSGGLSGGGSHSYPSSGGLSGGGSHSYPSGGLSGGGSHGYPSSGGVSGGGRGGLPAGGTGSHSYPAAGGGSHGYPSSGGNSGSHGYPASGGLSGSGSSPGNKGSYPSGGTTNVHHHYHYSPPQQISYASPRGGPPVSYPVYRGTPPTYVYQYKDSGSKYGTLLAGLALLNLGVLGGAVYANSHSHSSNSYKPQPGEICKFGVRKENGDYEETRIDCQLITSFIFAEQAKPQNQPTNTSVVTTTVTNTTIVNTTNPIETTQAPGAVTVNVSFTMLPNGTLVPIEMSTNGTANATTEVPPAAAGGGSSSVVVTQTTTNTTVVNALDVKGKPVEVTPGMQCYVIRNSPSSNMRKNVPCGLLQTYADKSIKQNKPNSAAQNIPAFTFLAVVCAVFVMN